MDCGARVKVKGKPWLGSTTSKVRGILAFLSVLAEDEREKGASQSSAIESIKCRAP